MMEILGNQLAYRTFNHTKVNDVEITIPDIREKSEFNIKSNVDYYKKYPELINSTYGVSDYSKKLNELYGNLYRVYETNAHEEVDFGKVECITSDEYPVLLDTQDIIAHQYSKSKVVLSYKTIGEKEKFRNSIIRVIAKEGATVDVFIVQTDENSKSLESVVVVAEKDATVNVRQYEMGAEENYTNAKIDLNGENAKADFKSIYFGHEENILNMFYHTNHNAPKTFSDIVINGALMDRSYKNLKTTLDFKEGCHESEGSEEEYTVLLEDTVLALSVPILLCHEDDVLGNHAASSGKIDPDLLFYIMSRGIDKDTAETLIVESKYAKTIDLLEDASSKQEIWDYFTKRMGKRG